MNVLIIPSYYGFGGYAGFGMSRAGVFFRRQAIALARHGARVTLLYVHFDRPSGVEVQEVDDEGVRCIYVHAAPLPLPINLIYKVLLGLWATHRYIGNHVDLIHAHAHRAGLIARPISRLLKVPYIVTEHSSQIESGLKFPWPLVARWEYTGAARVVAVSAGLARRLERYTHRPITVLPNLVSDGFFARLQTPTSTAPARPFQFISVGRAHYNKGWDVLLRAFADLIAKGADASLELIGGGPEEEELIKQATNLQIQDRVRFCGRLSPEDIADRMVNSDCHVLASRRETFGIVTIEAMALGLPVIMTRTDAAEDIVTPDCGLVVDIDNQAGLTDAMESIMSTYATFDPVSISSRCRTRFSEEVVAGQILNLYREVVSQSD